VSCASRSYCWLNYGNKHDPAQCRAHYLIHQSVCMRDGCHLCWLLSTSLHCSCVLAVKLDAESALKPPDGVAQSCLQPELTCSE
jgi:hypothetical protein